MLRYAKTDSLHCTKDLFHSQRICTEPCTVKWICIRQNCGIIERNIAAAIYGYSIKAQIGVTGHWYEGSLVRERGVGKW